MVQDLKDCKKIGVLGGTFDPIHYGHLALAEEARFRFGLDAVVFMPAGRPPHKVHGYGRVVSDCEFRFEMVVAATAGNPGFYVSRMEIERQGRSYTFETINNLRNFLPQAEIYFIMGADAFFEIESWRNADELLRACGFVAATRAGFDTKRLKKQVGRLKNKYGARVHYLEIPGIDISSTQLRKRVHSGAPLKYLVPAKVNGYIKQHGLYLQDEMELWREGVKQMLRKTLDYERYAHTLGVCKEALRLARLYGADTEKVHTAALLHDCAKTLTANETFEYCAKNDIRLDDYMLENPGPIHALIGAHMARHVFGVTDKEILNAIKRHTIGNKKMTITDKIVFVADVTEHGRDAYVDVTAARAAAAQNINAALKLAHDIKTEHLLANGGSLHPNSVKMLKRYC